MEKLTPPIIINGYWVGVRRYVKVVVLTEWLWVTMTEDATILSLPLGRVQGGRRVASNPAVRPPSVALQLPAGRPNRTTTAQREAKRARPPGRLSQSSPVFWVRAPASSQHGRQPCTTFWARTPVHQLILDTQSGNTMVVLNPNQNSTSTSEAASRMSAQYLSSLYVQPLPHEVSS